ncbi:pimeloyl-ACP methyl ester carboxylesterase [Microbacterium ginsengiterrae]|uniref:Pimeloyl-ACP methyl ester carboxylesterase n=1 Tax=Microbacterium ginsengiterrae TaxID=546115 RepID=A0A7W9C9Q7_9MICO|nr:pimeloyl-ACP methyl ester carboxylesterase [Microbacterium ginsengiterrae]
MTRPSSSEVPDLRVDDLGDPHGRPVLLLHGGGVGGWMWQPLIARMGSGYRFLVPDLPGHDRSAHVDYESHAVTVRALLAALQHREQRPVTVVGFSLGAQIAVLLAAHHPDRIARVAIISAQAEPSRWPGMTLGLLRAAAPLATREWFAKAQAKELFVPPALFPEYLRTAQRLSTRSLLTSVGENIRFTVPDAWSGYPGESLVLAGERERAPMIRSAHRLAGVRPGQHAEIIPECGHGVPLQKPQWLAQRLRVWLDGAHRTEEE